MVQQKSAQLNIVFAALSHEVRRETLDTLGRGARSVSELAAPHGITLTGFTKHLRALQAAGLIACAKEGRTVTCQLVPHRLDRAAGWLANRKELWNERLDALSRHLHESERTAHSGGDPSAVHETRERD